MTEPLPETIIRHWIREVVIGRSLCPFAAGVITNSPADEVAVQSVPDEDMNAALEALVLMAHDFVESPAETLVTVFPRTFLRFDDFMDGVNALSAYLEETKLAGDLQLAYFHPEFRFEGELADGASNFTNRSPLPAIQLLRVARVEEAITQFQVHSDPASIYERNIRTMDALSFEELEKLRTPFGITIARANERRQLMTLVKKGVRVRFCSALITTERTFSQDVQVQCAALWRIT